MMNVRLTPAPQAQHGAAPKPTATRGEARVPARAAAKQADVYRAVASGIALTGASLLACTFSANAADIALGRTVFNNNCAACHTGGNNSVIPDRTLKKAALEQYLAGGFNVEAIIYQVENGKGAMPAWADRLDEDEIKAVANFVFETASKDNWANE